ncbi:hypothetical protein B5807_10100 [Epicoccum nigrum]|uniref:Uncharacterized protein n=1 Tax=Epicoccum nigrum TaxID=105696 RepID=A0A1Y2LTZ1_EPING|nr:hypothetical protein B5807_10100 [Epicoccum nigrum]
MVAFGKLITSAVALAIPALAAVTPAQIVSNIEMITQKSAALQAPAKTITLVNAPLLVIGQGPLPTIITGFTDIVTTATNAISQMQGSSPVPAGADSDAIADAFRSFVRVHQELLNILIGKAGLLNTLPFVGAPMAAVLRQVESVVDTIAFSLIDMVESRAKDLQADAQSLDGTLETCINAYSGVTNGITKRSLRYARREIAA